MYIVRSVMLKTSGRSGSDVQVFHGQIERISRQKVVRKSRRACSKATDVRTKEDLRAGASSNSTAHMASQK